MLSEMSSMELVEWAAWMEITAWERKEGRSATALYRPGAPAV